MKTCNEILNDDIIRIDFYDVTNTTAAVTCSVPFNVPAVANMKVMQGDVDLGYPFDQQGNRIDTPVLSLDFSGERTTGAMSAPKHKATQKASAAGRIYTHTLTVPVEIGFDAVQQSVYELQGREVMCVLTAYDDTRLCIHILPESSELTYEDERGSGHNASLKYTAQSLSQLVLIGSSSSSSSE